MFGAGLFTRPLAFLAPREAARVRGVPNYKVGDYLYPEGVTIAPSGLTAPGANSLRFFKSRVLQDCTIDRLFVRVVTVQAAQNVQAAVYEDNTGANRIGALVVAGGSMSTAVAAAVEATVSATLYAGRYYWFASCCDHATPTFYSQSINGQAYGASVIGSATLANTAAGVPWGVSFAGTFGTWPDMTGNAVVDVGTQSIPLVGFRVASLL